MAWMRSALVLLTAMTGAGCESLVAQDDASQESVVPQVVKTSEGVTRTLEELGKEKALIAVLAWGITKSISCVAFDASTRELVVIEDRSGRYDANPWLGELLRISVEGKAESAAKLRLPFEPTVMCIAGTGPDAHVVVSNYLLPGAAEFGNDGRIIWTNSTVGPIEKLLAVDLDGDQTLEVLAAANGVFEMNRSDGSIGRKLHRFGATDIVSFGGRRGASDLLLILGAMKAFLYGTPAEPRELPTSFRYVSIAVGTIAGRDMVLGVRPAPLQAELRGADGSLVWRVENVPIKRDEDRKQYDSTAALSSTHPYASIAMADGYVYVLSTTDGSLLCTIAAELNYPKSFWTRAADGAALLVLADQGNVQAYRVR